MNQAVASRARALKHSTASVFQGLGTHRRTNKYDPCLHGMYSPEGRLAITDKHLITTQEKHIERCDQEYEEQREDSLFKESDQGSCDPCRGGVLGRGNSTCKGS